MTALARREVVLREVNWLGATPMPASGAPIEAKLRSAAEPAAAMVKPSEAGAVIEFEQPQFGVAPGQAAVFYSGSQVLGGGWITAAERAAVVPLQGSGRKV